MRRLRLPVAALVMLSAAFLGSAPVGASAAGDPKPLTCSGGPIAPGRYESIRVTGVCSIPGGLVSVEEGLVIDPGAGLDATNPAGTLHVRRDVHVKWGGLLGLGCSQPDGGCTPPDNRIGGELAADHPLALLVYSTHIAGHFALHGGSAPVNCDPSPALGGAPVFSAIEDNVIDGEVSISSYQGCWFGFIRNVTRESVKINNNTFADPDATEVVSNTVEDDLICHQNSPAAQVGDSFGAPNIVGGKKVGQCASL